MKKIVLDFKSFFLKPLVYVYFIVSLLLYEFILYYSRGSSIFNTNAYFGIGLVLFIIPTYAALSGVLGRLYIKKFYTSFFVFLFFWSITMLVSYHIVDMNHVISIYDFITIIANAISYAVFYGITFTIGYCLKKVK